MKFPKSARLHHRSLQEQLFRKGSHLNQYPLRMVWRSLSEEELRANFRNSPPDLIGRIQILVSVPKKMRRRAVDRVRMRRVIREAFRLGRGPLIDSLERITAVRTLSIALIYRKEENMDYTEIRLVLDKLIEKLIKKLEAKYIPTETADELSLETGSEAAEIAD